jgi:hypothetical protein
VRVKCFEIYGLKRIFRFTSMDDSMNASNLDSTSPGTEVLRMVAVQKPVEGSSNLMQSPSWPQGQCWSSGRR